MWLSLYGLAGLYYKQGKDVDATLPLMERAIRIVDATTGNPDLRIKAYAWRARMRKQKGDMPGALSDLIAALHSAEKLRPQVGGGEETRAGFFERYTDHFNRMVAWQLEVGQIEPALEYAERGRARVMLDQLAAGQVDLRNRIPEDIRVSLEKRETDAKARLAEYQQRMTRLRSRKDLSAEERNRQTAALQDSLRLADRDYQQVYEKIKQASPLWHDLITSGGQPVTMADVQNRLVPENGLMLLYQIGNEGSHLFVIPAAGQKPEAMPLQVPDNLAAVLQVEAGPLKSTALQKILVGSDTTKDVKGLLEYLRSRHADAAPEKSATAKLHALWQVLAPASLWPRLVACTKVIIIPDGVLHLLPFEALVVQTASKPGATATRYWLDAGPVICYAPSATTLYNLEQRQLVSSVAQTLAVSLSDPIFDPKTVASLTLQEQYTKKPAARHDSSLANVAGLDSLSVALATRGNFERAAGALLRLEATARETEEIRKAFGRNRVVALTRLEANEARLRAELPGKRYLHFATHGVVDQQRSALFAALALTPPVRASEPARASRPFEAFEPPKETTTAENDGFLQLYEIYELKLPDCELAVLSACQTNFGRYFEGEGVFALSRGFLAAGAHRVIASHWAVDDVSAAELIGAFFRPIAAAERTGSKPDYARALRDAKRKARRQEQWAAPYFWAPFVLTGKR